MKFFSAFIITSIVASSALHAQTWSVINLAPAGATDSSGLYAIVGSQQVGDVQVAGNYEAAIWSGTAASIVNLNPPGISTSAILATTGTQQAGEVQVAGKSHAALWSGTAASFVDLHPSITYANSYINAISGTQEAGYATSGTNAHAAIWAGTLGSFLDLNPGGATVSALNATNGTQQGGFARIPANTHAGLWTGTPESFIDLNPSGSSGSDINAMTSTLQAGYATFGGNSHAGIWSGTAASFIDLHPAAASQSYLNAIFGSVQAGAVTIGGNSHAGFWAGTAASFVDLNSFLPANYTVSYGQGISSDGTHVFVVGYAYNSVPSRYEAIIWKFTPAPGLVISGKKSVKTSKPKLVIKGSASGDVTSITYQIKKKSGSASGTNTWKFTAKLQPGKNVITVISHGPGGVSTPAKITVTRS